MKSLIEITEGKLTNSKVTAYISKSICDSDTLNGFDCALNFKKGYFDNLNIKIAQNNTETCYLWVRPNSITSFTDIECNVNVVVTRDFTIIQWVGFLGVSLYRKLIIRGK